ncbi:MAG: peptide ABC transporter substrate-binding protein [Dehalococcoidia bacterium]
MLAVVGLLAFVLLATRRNDGQLVPAEGGTLVESSIGPVERVNPLLAVTPAERDLAALVFSGLTRPGPGGEALPDVAEAWDVSNDGRSFTFALRRDLSWHDGAPVRVEDVLFTIKLIQAGAVADQRLADVWRPATVSRVDARRVRVDLPAPYAPLPAYAGFGLLPEHLLRDLTPADLATVTFNQRPVGNGPFRLQSLDGDRAELARYDRYHLGAPYLEGIELRIDADREGADATVLGAAGVTGDRVTYPLSEQAYVAVMLNNDAPLFATDTVRRALSLAVDRRALVAKTLGGRGAPTDVPFAPGSWAHDGQEPPPPDLDLARQLLESAGWTPGPDGVLQRGTTELRFTLVTTDEPVWTGIAGVLADTWSQIGARVTVAPAQSQALLDDFLNPRRYEAALIGWDPGFDPDPFTAWHSSLRGEPGGNPANFADEQSDALLVEGRVLGSEEQRRERYRTFQTRFRELAPSIVLFTEIVRYAVREEFRLSLPASGPDASARFTDVRRWFTNTRHSP